MVHREPRTGVVCVRCGKPIVLDQAGHVAEEFTVRCGHCGHRDFYRIKDIKPLDENR
jgi:DNA-directed RNA polymerase subunit RPC12/RpoP